MTPGKEVRYGASGATVAVDVYGRVFQKQDDVPLGVDEGGEGDGGK